MLSFKDRLDAKISRLASSGMERFGLDPALFGYLGLPTADPWVQGSHGINSFDEYISAEDHRFPLPFNILAREELSRNVPDRLNLSFYDVPELKTKSARHARVCNARVLCCANEWGRDSYAIVTEDNHRLCVQGLEYRKGHANMLRHRRECRPKDHVAWVLTRFPGSYFRWVTQILPRIILTEELGVADRLMLPDRQWCTSFMSQSLEMLGVEDAERIRPLDDGIRCRTIDVFDADPFCRPLLDRLRKRLVPHAVSSASRRVFISRREARWRKLANEDQIWPILQHAGFERHVLENIPFRDQCTLLGETRVLWGLHGAGLANMIFCPPGAIVVEVSDPGRPNPHFYALAATLGHHYGLIYGEPFGDHSQGIAYRDLSVSSQLVEDMLHQVSSML